MTLLPLGSLRSPPGTVLHFVEDECTTYAIQFLDMSREDPSRLDAAAFHVLAAEVAALEADEADRAEMLSVAEMMASLRPEGPSSG